MIGKTRRSLFGRAAVLALTLSILMITAGTVPAGAAAGIRYEIPENDALAFTGSMKTGWNLGNTFDAYDCWWLQDPMDYEGGWLGGVKTTPEMIEALQDAGFQSIRIPVSWHNHVTGAGNEGVVKDWIIDEAWLKRVQTVADWAYDRGMHVILNIHHDCAPDFYYPDEAHFESSSRYVNAVWSQLAEKFRDYGERLIFEAVNEPRLSADPGREWQWNPSDPVCREAMDCVCRLNQVFVDTVRASGGNNASRYLMVPSYAASAYCACDDSFRLPEDQAENRIIVSVHAYTPYSFALEMPGTDSFSLEDSGAKAEITDFMDALYQRYISRGIPVILGEYGAREKSNTQARVTWTAFYLAQASARGIPCLWWDNGSFSGDGENFAILDRSTLQWPIPEIPETIRQYGNP